jgi:pimeloyl-ACP methyl ester carboxylesterase
MQNEHAADSPELRHFSSAGVDIAFIDAKPQERDLGEPILLIHGFASNHRINWVNPRWVDTLTKAGRRVVAFDNRGHGQSEKLYAPADYHADLMTRDAANLVAHLGIERADVMGYSMGARIAAYCALLYPPRVRSVILGGLGMHLVEGVGLPESIAFALEAISLDEVTDPSGRTFRRFAEQTASDLAALAACIRGSRQTLTREEVARIAVPVLIAVGTNDKVAGSALALAALIPGARALDIPGRDHMVAVGDRVFKAAVLEFLAARP